MKRLLVVAAAALTLVAHADTYPTAKPVTIVVPFTAGGPTDRVARDLAEAMRKPLGGATVVVDNAAGAGGSIGANKVAKAAPDGYTLLLHHIAMATMPTLVRNIPFKVDSDFEYLGMINDVPMTLIGKPALPAANYQELSSWISANTDRINVGNAGVGSASHLCGLMMMNALNVKFNEIPYKGTGPALTDLMGGQVDLMCDQTSGTVPSVKTDKIKAYAAIGKTRLSGLPDLPAIAEAGVQGLDITISFGLYAPKGTPKPVMDLLTSALQKSVADPEVRQRLDAMGITAVSPDMARPEALRAHLKYEMDNLNSLLTKAGVKAN